VGIQVNNNERRVAYPAIYRHFKEKYYATMGISYPYVNFTEHLKESVSDVFRVAHTETCKWLTILVVNGNYYHNSDECTDTLVVYKPLYNDIKSPYARPVSMFLEQVDKVKYPDVKQEYRFELISS
jgi:hypothetical protein